MDALHLFPFTPAAGRMLPWMEALVTMTYADDATALTFFFPQKLQEQIRKWFPAAAACWTNLMHFTYGFFSPSSRPALPSSPCTQLSRAQQNACFCWAPKNVLPQAAIGERAGQTGDGTEMAGNSAFLTLNQWTDSNSHKSTISTILLLACLRINVNWYVLLSEPLGRQELRSWAGNLMRSVLSSGKIYHTSCFLMYWKYFMLSLSCGILALLL